MRKAAITGSAGLLGTHMCIFLSTVPDIETVAIDHAAFDSNLEEMLQGVDTIFHFAGVNRGDDTQIEDGNVSAAERLIEAIQKNGSRPHVIFSSSIQEGRDSAYGRSKAAARSILETWAQEDGGSFTSLQLPHIFGEGGKPFYNSVVSTFCHQIASNEQPQIDQDGEIEPLHAQRACEEIVRIARTVPSEPKGIRLTGRHMRVSEMLHRLSVMAKSYAQGIFPDMRDTFDLDLFNTYRSYLYPDHYPVALTKHADPRGELVETVKERNGGQVSFSTTRPGITRGNHFHRHKVERFLVVSGQADIGIRKIGDDEAKIFAVTGDKPAFVDIPTLHTHNITNTGDDDLLTLFWVHEIFDPENADTYPVDV